MGIGRRHGASMEKRKLRAWGENQKPLSKCFTCIVLFKPHNNPEFGTVISLILLLRKWRPRKLN